MTARPLAPEADLAHVLDLAKVALRTGTMIDPEDLLCDLLQLDERQLQEWLEPTPDRPLPAPDQSRPASRAREWRQAEAGVVQHLVVSGRPLCAADDAGPWRTVAGVTKCAGCLELEEVLGRHG